jgi:hypothetical protein
MQPLNYCRQMVKQFRALAKVPSLEEAVRERALYCISAAAVSEKFILPVGGFLIDDKDFRALDELQRLRLPFKAIALEYESPRDSDPMRSSSKRIIFAVEMEEGLLFRSVIWADAAGVYLPQPLFLLQHGDYLRRDLAPEGIPSVVMKDMHTRRDPGPVPDEERKDSGDEARVLLGFCNALSCSNVRFDRQELSKVRMAMRKKSALPFDTYHVLTIEPAGSAAGSTGLGGSHRSPREHLRRGHIRRLSDGRRLWVNATVVAAGRGAGVVTKDYAMRRAK